jgi:uncharacterized membrane protein
VAPPNRSADPSGSLVRQTAETARLTAFSDGVLAVAITLLVLDLKVPRVGAGRLAHTLLEQWPSYAAYVTSFLVIGIMWINHHSIFRVVARVDRQLMFLNLLLLMVIVTIPFSTSLVAEYLLHSGINGKIAMAVYSAVTFVVGLIFGALWGYALAHPYLLEPTVDVDAARRTWPRFAAGTAIYAALIVVSLLNVLVALALHLAVAVYYAFERLTVSPQAPEAAS